MITWLTRCVALLLLVLPFVFVAADGGHDTLVEAGVDDVRIERPS